MPPVDFAAADAFIWHPDGRLAPVPRVNRVGMSLLKGIDRVRDMLVENTERFAKGLPANNALLWGARGMGKSSLVKASHAAVNAMLARNGKSGPLKLIEIHREDIESLPELMAITRERALPLHRVLRRPVVRFRRHQLQVAQGGAGRRHRGPARQRDLLRHLQPAASVVARHDRERALDRRSIPAKRSRRRCRCPTASGCGSASTAAARTNTSPWSSGYVAHYRVPVDEDALRREALEWATTRGSRSGRVAWQFVQDLAGRLGVRLASSE